MSGLKLSITILLQSTFWHCCIFSLYQWYVFIFIFGNWHISHMKWTFQHSLTIDLPIKWTMISTPSHNTIMWKSKMIYKIIFVSKIIKYANMHLLEKKCATCNAFCSIHKYSEIIFVKKKSISWVKINDWR